MKNTTKETLTKHLELLIKSSDECEPCELESLTNAILSVTNYLDSLPNEDVVVIKPGTDVHFSSETGVKEITNRLAAALQNIEIR